MNSATSYPRSNTWKKYNKYRSRPVYRIRMIGAEKAGLTNPRRRQRRSSSVSSDDAPDISRTPSPLSGDTGTLNRAGDSAARLSMQDNPSKSGKDFRFKYNWRIALVLLPALYLVAEHAGFYAKLTLLVGFVAGCAFDEARFPREHSLMTVWFTSFVTVLFVWFSFIFAIRISPWNLLLAHNMTQILFLTGLWGALQFPWIWRENPTISRLMERLLIGVTPLPCAVLFSWSFAEALGAEFASLLSSFTFTVTFMILSRPLPRSESPQNSKIHVLGPLERTFHAGFMCILPAVMFASARWSSSNRYLTVCGTLALIFMPCLLLFSIPFSTWRETINLNETFLFVGTMIGLPNAVGSAFLLHPSTIDLETRNRILILLGLIPLLFPQIERFKNDASSSAITMNQFIAMLIGTIMFFLGFPPRNILISLPLILVAMSRFVSLYGLMKITEAQAKTFKFGEDIRPKRISLMDRMILISAVLVGFIDCIPQDKIGPWIGLALSISFVAASNPRSDFQHFLVLCGKFGILFSYVLIEKDVLRMLPQSTNQALVFASCIVFLTYKFLAAEIIKQLARLRVDKKSWQRKVVRDLTSDLSDFSQIDKSLILSSVVGRTLLLNESEPVSDAMVGMLIVFGGVCQVPFHSAFTVFAIRVGLQLMLCLGFFSSNQIMGLALAALSSFYGVACNMKKTGRSQHTAFALGATLAIPLLSHLIMSFVTTMEVNEQDWTILCGLALFGSLAAHLDVLRDLAFPFACTWLVLLGHKASLVIVASTFLLSLFLASTSLYPRISSFTGIFACQLFGLAFEKDATESKLEAIHLFFVLLVASRASFHRAMRWKSLGFDQEFISESILSRLFALAYLFQGFFALVMNHLLPLGLLPVIPYGLIGLISFRWCCRLAMGVTTFVWVVETLIEDEQFVGTQIVGNEWDIQLHFSQVIFAIVSQLLTNEPSMDTTVLLMPALIMVLLLVRTWNERGLVVWATIFAWRTILFKTMPWLAPSSWDSRTVNPSKKDKATHNQSKSSSL